MVTCEKQLEELGFIQVSDNLWMKKKENGIRLYRDYRNGVRNSYAYNHQKWVSKDLFKEFKSIEKIEARMSSTILVY